ADWTAGNHRRTSWCRLKKHRGTTVLGGCVVRDGVVDNRYVDEMLFGVGNSLLDRRLDIIGLAQPHANAALAVANHHQGAEAHALTAFDGPGDAVNVDNALFELFLFAGFSWFTCHCVLLERESGVAQRVCERLHPAMVAVAASVKDERR